MIRASKHGGLSFSGAQDDAENRKRKTAPKPSGWEAFGKGIAGLHAAGTSFDPKTGFGTRPPDPAPPGPAPAPWLSDPIYQGQEAVNDQRYNDTGTDLTADFGTQASRLGFTYGGDVDSGFTFGGFDPNNPYSQSALLKRHFDQAKRGNTNSMASRGQLYSGALQNAQNENQFQYDKGSDAIRKQIDDLIRDTLRRRRDSKTALSEAGLAGREASINRALAGG